MTREELIAAAQAKHEREDLLTRAQAKFEASDSGDSNETYDDKLASAKSAEPKSDTLISMKSPSEVNWKDALIDEITAPFTGTRASRPVPPSVDAATKSMGLVAAINPTAAIAPNNIASTGGILNRAPQIPEASGLLSRAAKYMGKQGVKKIATSALGGYGAGKLLGLLKD